jgi:nucleotide-binding universal stress UspA family protein
VTNAAALPELMTTVDHGFTDFLVAYDFSTAANTALKYAAELSSHLGSTIHLINVETPAEHSQIMRTEPRVREHVHEDTRRAFDNIEKRLRAKGISCDSAHRVGDVSDVLEGATLESKIDLLLLGAFGHGPTDRPQLGSTAEPILQATHERTPVGYQRGSQLWRLGRWLRYFYAEKMSQRGLDRWGKRMTILPN